MFKDNQHWEKYVRAFVASESEWMKYGAEMGWDMIVELKSQCRPSQSRKESILNCLLRGKWCFTYKSKGGIGSRNIGPLGRGWNIGGNKRAGLKTMAACLGELTTEREKEAKQWQPVWNDFELEKRKIS